MANQQLPMYMVAYPETACFYFIRLNNIDFISNYSSSFSQETMLEKNTYFEQLFCKQLEKKHKLSYVKQWTEQEDQRIVQLGSKCRNWKQLSKQFVGKSAKVCHRRFKKLVNKQMNWPNQIETKIKHLRQVQRKSWLQIQIYFKQSTKNSIDYSAKKIRQRYKNYLQMRVSREKWSMQQDLQLWNQVKLKGKIWKQISQHFPTRNCLQIRNRYYKFLQPIARKTEELILDEKKDSQRNFTNKS